MDTYVKVDLLITVQCNDEENVSEYSEAHKTVEYGGDCSIQVLIFNTVVSSFLNTMKTTFLLKF